MQTWQTPKRSQQRRFCRERLSNRKIKNRAGSVLSEVNTVPGDNVKESEIEPPVFSAEVKFVQNDLMADEPSQMIAVKAEEKTKSFDSIHSESI